MGLASSVFVRLHANGAVGASGGGAGTSLHFRAWNTETRQGQNVAKQGRFWSTACYWNLGMGMTIMFVGWDQPIAELFRVLVLFRPNALLDAQ